MRKWLTVAALLGSALGVVPALAAQDAATCEPYVVTDVLAGSGITAVAFGGVQYGGISAAPVTLTAVAQGNANLRAEAGTNAAIVGGLRNGETMTLVGRSEAGDWLRLEHDGQPAWVFANLVSVEGDISTLPVGDVPAVAPETTNQLLVMPPEGCTGSPNSGLLLQSPLNEVRQVYVNGLIVGFNGTVLLHVTDASTRIMNIDFNSLAAVGNAGIEIPSGSVMEIDTDGNAVLPFAYKFEDVQGLPLDMLPVTVQRPTSYATNFSLLPCGFSDDDRSLREAPAGEPIEVRLALFGDADGEESLRQLITQGEFDLTLDGDPVDLWSVRGPLLTLDGGFQLHLYWVIFEPQSGIHQIILNTSGTGSLFDGEISCVLDVK